MIKPETYHCDNCGKEELADKVFPFSTWVTVKFHKNGYERHYCCDDCARPMFGPWSTFSWEAA